MNTNKLTTTVGGYLTFGVLVSLVPTKTSGNIRVVD